VSDPISPTAASTLELSERPTGTRFSVFAKPRASKNRIAGVRAGALEVAVAAPPVDGAANEAIRALVAEVLSLPKRDVEIVAGASGKSKIVEVALPVIDTRARLLRALGERT
jgi:uncharacterized protein (TIGR00251 family)